MSELVRECAKDSMCVSSQIGKSEITTFYQFMRLVRGRLYYTLQPYHELLLDDVCSLIVSPLLGDDQRLFKEEYPPPFE